MQVGRIVDILNDTQHNHQGFPVVEGTDGIDVSTILFISFEISYVLQVALVV